MFTGIRSRIALAAALAIVATSFAPAVATFAAPLAPAVDVDVAPAKPDVRVELFQKYAGNYGLTHIIFDVYNDGAPSGPVAVKGECLHFDGTSTIVYARVMAPMATHQDNQDYFKCSDYWGARVTVGTQGDSNTSNNVLTL